MRFNSTVKGVWANDNYATGDYVFAGGIWSKAVSGATPSDVAHNPDDVDPYNQNEPYSEGT